MVVLIGLGFFFFFFFQRNYLPHSFLSARLSTCLLLFFSAFVVGVFVFFSLLRLFFFPLSFFFILLFSFSSEVMFISISLRLSFLEHPFLLHISLNFLSCFFFVCLCVFLSFSSPHLPSHLFPFFSFLLPLLVIPFILFSFHSSRPPFPALLIFPLPSVLFNLTIFRFPFKPTRFPFLFPFFPSPSFNSGRILSILVSPCVY